MGFLADVHGGQRVQLPGAGPSTGRRRGPVTRANALGYALLAAYDIVLLVFGLRLCLLAGHTDREGAE
jgi:hypothetical protein